MRNKNLIVLGSVLILTLILFGLAKLTVIVDAPAPQSFAPILTADAETPVPQSETSGTTTAPVSSGEPAKAYLVVTVNNMMYLPIPLREDGSFTLTQKDIGAVNVVHVTPDSVFMESSTCEGQDCVKQGMVSLENRHQRVLGNMIICLPNKVVLELYSPEEAQELLSTNEAGAP